MKNHFINSEGSSRNSFANIVVMLVGSLAIAASLVLGLFALIVVAIVVAMAAVVVGARLWWFGRSLEKTRRASSDTEPGSTAGVIEGEYSVIDEGREAE